MSTQIHSIIHDRKEIKTTALSIRRGVDKQTVMYVVGVLFSLKRNLKNSNMCEPEYVK